MCAHRGSSLFPHAHLFRPAAALFAGIVLDPPRIITEYHERGSLNQVIKRTTHEQWDVQAKARKDLSWGNRCALGAKQTPGLVDAHGLYLLCDCPERSGESQYGWGSC